MLEMITLFNFLWIDLSVVKSTVEQATYSEKNNTKSDRKFDGKLEAVVSRLCLSMPVHICIFQIGRKPKDVLLSKTIGNPKDTVNKNTGIFK